MRMVFSASFSWSKVCSILPVERSMDSTIAAYFAFVFDFPVWRYFAAMASSAWMGVCTA